MRRKRYMSRILYVFFEGENENEEIICGQEYFDIKNRNAVTPRTLEGMARGIEIQYNLTNVAIENYRFMN